MPLNVGVGDDLSIAELAATVARVIGYSGEVRYDSSKPDGTPRKLLDVTRLQELGWKASIGLEQGIASTYSWFCANLPRANAPASTVVSR
jgi:nucleoside-diphosphate-sugar epimerase